MQKMFIAIIGKDKCTHVNYEALHNRTAIWRQLGSPRSLSVVGMGRPFAPCRNQIEICLLLFCVEDSVHPGHNRRTSTTRPQWQEKHSLTKGPHTSSNPNLLDIPFASNKRSGSLVRQTFCTPLSQPGYSRLRKSPALSSSLKKDTRPITDKHWQFDQLSKVRNFIVKQFDHLKLYDISSIKSGISMDVFISLINNYFQMLDNQAFVLRENYMEEVPKILKSFGYPGNVKPSLMKTVNTPYSWPHILAIFSWLSDLISEIDIPPDYAPFSGIYNVVYEDSLNLLRQLQNSKEPEEMIRQQCLDNLDQEIVTYLNLDVNLLKDIDSQIERLRFDIEKSETKNRDLQTNIKVIQGETTELTEKCDKYEHKSKTFLTQLEQQRNKHQEQIHKMGGEVLALRNKEQKIQAVIDSQPYSLSQKEELTKEVASLKVSKELQEQRRQQQQKVIHEYDSQLTELAQNIQANAYKFNNMVNDLELSNPKFKKLHIRESCFARSDTEEELKGAGTMIQVAMNNIKKGLQSCEDDIEKLVTKEKKLQGSIDDAVKEIQELNKLDAELTVTLEFERNQAALKCRQQADEMNKAKSELGDIKRLRLDLSPLEKQINVLQKQKAELEEVLQRNQNESLFFFQQLQKQTNQTAITYMDIMRNTSDAFRNVTELIDIEVDRAFVLEK